MSDQHEKMTAWNDRWKSRGSIPVAYVPNPEEEDPDFQERYVTTTYGPAFMFHQPKDGSDPRAVIRLADYGTGGGRAPLDHLEVLEDVLAKLGQMGKVEGDDAIQRYPECPDCYEEMNWDEGFDCSICLTHFDDNCDFSYKVCVEYDCTESADLVGEDGQPRCINCTTLILAGEQEPFSPYNCKSCGKVVAGIPARSPAGKSRLCGPDQAAKDRRAYLDDIMQNRRY